MRLSVHARYNGQNYSADIEWPEGLSPSLGIEVRFIDVKLGVEVRGPIETIKLDSVTNEVRAYVHPKKVTGGEPPIVALV